MKILFEEIQDFTQKFIWFVVSGLFFLSIFAIIQQVIFKIPFGTNPAPDYLLFVISFFMLFLVLLLWTSKLKIKITEEGIYYKYAPFHFKTRIVPWSDVGKAYVRVYSPMGEYGGWGIRFSSKNGKAFNVQGNTGLQLEMKNGKKILFGTQKSKEIEEVLKKVDIK